jgi:hypothetical protein
VATIRYIGNEPVELRLNGHPRGGSYGAVEPDQLVEVDDEVFLAHAWPEALWSEVDVPDRGEDGAEDKPADTEAAPAATFNDDEE